MSVPATSRRDFLKTTGAVAGALAAAPLVHAGGSDRLKIGLIGCGGRGNGAICNCLDAAGSENVSVVAFADLWQDLLSTITLESAAVWLDLVEQTGQTAAGLRISGHFLYVG